MEAIENLLSETIRNNSLSTCSPEHF